MAVNAVRNWTKLWWSALGSAALVGAGQFGVLYGLGVLDWRQDFTRESQDRWSALLTWVGFALVVAVVGGATAGRRSVRRHDRREGIGTNVMAALGATVGAATPVLLVWLPARSAQPPEPVQPELVVALTAVAALVAGLLIAIVALSVAPFAGNFLVSAVWIWLLVIAAAAAESLTGGTSTTGSYQRVGVLYTPHVWAGRPAWLGAGIMIIFAALLTAVVAAVARWGSANRAAVAVSGLGGPLAVAAAYVIAGPGNGPDHSGQAGPYRASLIAIGAGLLVSAIVAMIRRRRPTDGSAERAVAAPPAPAADATAQMPVGAPVPMPRAVSGADTEYVDWVQHLGPDGMPAGGRHQAAGGRTAGNR